ncbi:hypothetical protein CDD80_917 [Ophiocordyceps camponoti-rufipedis]|uniref:Cytochrome b5 heme-binding domain-containing protein n=1 Tax=Ophiocordyceps camponoti-rufipedis TaxID=2004952 RepID=A0A2C5YHD9_9HYPO|nr:hypothetical protein CDD80_917 [Ophiocordyceps camponoti-rufipedis]
MSQKYTPAQVSQHGDDSSGYWLIIEDGVYDISNFIDEHPGGPKILKRFAGKNATKAFWKYHGENVLKRYGEKFRIGDVAEAAKL